ncbi:hypothetical protein G9P44_004901 [Scheffersomyces stipitis]|nr:hypothetical protein G9P44_004901 [Scheffersomyces stipitis]
MDFDEPLPLIRPPKQIPSVEAAAASSVAPDRESESESSEEASADNSAIYYAYGYGIIAVSWMIFLVSANSFFRIWQFVIEPLRSCGYESLYFQLATVFSTADNYVLSMWSIYVVVWWWAIVSWCGLKLFRHSKGGVEAV